MRILPACSLDSPAQPVGKSAPLLAHSHRLTTSMTGSVFESTVPTASLVAKCEGKRGLKSISVQSDIEYWAPVSLNMPTDSMW